MKYINKLHPGLAVELVLEDGEFQGTYRTHLDEVGQRIFSVVAPYVQGAVLPLHEGMSIRIVFYDDICAYSFTSKIIQRIAVPIPLFVLEMPDSMQRVQRRQYVRVPAFFPVAYRSVTRQGLSDEKKAEMQDLSGGGMKFQAREAVESKALLYVRLGLPTGELQTPARVCRVNKVDGVNRWEVSVEFYDITERERDRIIRCVFDLQREMRRKGLV